MSRIFTSSKPCAWVVPRQQQHASTRYQVHGPIQSMIEEEPGFFRKLFGRGW